jgi:hypothetical protein
VFICVLPENVVGVAVPRVSEPPAFPPSATTDEPKEEVPPSVAVVGVAATPPAPAAPAHEPGNAVAARSRS